MNEELPRCQLGVSLAPIRASQDSQEQQSGLGEVRGVTLHSGVDDRRGYSLPMEHQALPSVHSASPSTGSWTCQVMGSQIPAQIPELSSACTIRFLLKPQECPVGKPEPCLFLKCMPHVPREPSASSAENLGTGLGLRLGGW